MELVHKVLIFWIEHVCNYVYFIYIHLIYYMLVKCMCVLITKFTSASYMMGAETDAIPGELRWGSDAGGVPMERWQRYDGFTGYTLSDGGVWACNWAKAMMLHSPQQFQVCFLSRMSIQITWLSLYQPDFAAV